jgi:hypothetical protein
MIELRPKDFDVREIGHFGVFKKRFQDGIWPRLLADIEAFTKADRQNFPSST